MLFLIFAVAVLLVLAWVYLAGDRAGEMVDEAPTTDVQNHWGDTRPLT